MRLVAALLLAAGSDAGAPRHLPPPFRPQCRRARAGVDPAGGGREGHPCGRREARAGPQPVVAVAVSEIERAEALITQARAGWFRS